MKYSYLILMGLLGLTPATYAERSGATEPAAMAQQANITVKGKVVDDKGEALLGATVQLKGTSTGTKTDLDGNFTLSVPSNGTLVISYVGYKKQEVAVDSKTKLGNIILLADANELTQLVVVGYGTQRKVDLTGSVAIVNAEELKKVSNSNISTMLEGKVAGVQITTDGQPGADPTVRIRGIGSFGSTAPLYVIDGVPMGVTIRDFSPNDIETIQVLKDASAAAIYGSRAGNGVVIITTKQGKKNQPMKISYSGYMGVDNIKKGVYDVMDAQQYGKFINMSYANFNMNVPGGYDPTNSNYLYNADGSAKVNTNWFDEAFKTGTRQDHSINLSGGGNNNTYNVSLDYYNQKGTMVGAGPNYERYTGRFVNTMDTKFIKLKTNIVYSHSTQDNMALSNANEYVQGLYGTQYPVMASALLTPPTIKAYDASTWVLDDKLSAATNYSYDSYGFGTYYDEVHGDLRMTNLLLVNSLLKRKANVDRIVANGTAEVDLLDMLKLKNKNHKLSYNLNLSYSKTFVKNLTFVPAFIQSTTNYLAKTDENLSETYNNYGTGLVENTLTYDGKIGLHHFNAVIGQSFEHNTTHNLTGTGITMNEPYYLQVGNSASQKSYSSEYENYMSSYIGRINYNYDDKYLLSLTTRRDGSSRLSPDDRWDWFPSASAGWRLEREKFFPIDEKVVNLFKLRGSYGELGSIVNLGDYDYMGTMNRNDYTYSFGNTKVVGSAISNYVNTSLKWEKKKSTDVGLDLGMFNNALEFNFDYYKSVSQDLHYAVPVPPSAGVSNVDVKMNAATMQNTGFEFLVAYHNHNNELKYDISANLTTIKNKVTSLGVQNEPATTAFTRTELGREVGSFYGYVSEGIFQSQSEIDNYTNAKGNHVTQNGAQAGDIKYADLNNDGTITAEDRKYLGSGLPKVNFGLNVRLEWKGFDLNVSSYGAAGFKAVDFVDMALHSSYGATNKSVDLLNAWTPENTNTSVPRVSYKSAKGQTVTNDDFSQRFLQNANYLKIANVEVGYNFPDKWFGGYINGVRLYVSAQNLATLTKYKGYNVDFSGGVYTPGYNYCSYPTPQTMMCGVHVSF